MRSASAIIGIRLTGTLAGQRHPSANAGWEGRASDSGGPDRPGQLARGAFTQLLNDSSRADYIPDGRIVAAFKGGRDPATNCLSHAHAGRRCCGRSMEGRTDWRGPRDPRRRIDGQVAFRPKAIVSAPPAPEASAAPVKRSSYDGPVAEIVEFFRTGKSPVPLDVTVEIMAFMEAADVRKARNGAAVALDELLKK